MDNISHQATLLYNNTKTNSNTVKTQILSLYDLSATLTPLLENYTPGNCITYISRIENTGSAAVYNLKIIDDLGKGTLNYITESAKAFINGNPVPVKSQINNDNITFIISNVLNPKDNVIIIFDVTSSMSNPASITTTQTILGNGGSLTGSTVEAVFQPKATVTLADYVSLNITKLASSDSIYDGDELSYTFEMTNSGNNCARDVTFSDTFPSGYKINSITLLPANSPTPITYDPATHLIKNVLTISHLTLPVGTSILTVSGIYHD